MRQGLRLSLVLMEPGLQVPHQMPDCSNPEKYQPQSLESPLIAAHSTVCVSIWLKDRDRYTKLAQCSSCS